MQRIALAAGLALCAPALAQPSLQMIPGLPGTARTKVSSISRSGAVVIGECDLPTFDGSVAYRWNVADAGPLSLNIPSTYRWQEPDCLTATGNVISGLVRTSNGTPRGFRWTAAGGFAIYGTLPGMNSSDVYSLSATGSMATGISYNTTTGAGLPFRWISGQPMQSLGNLPGMNLGAGMAISADGSVIAGFSGTASTQRAFRWTPQTGIQDLGLLPDTTEAVATAISADGTVITGRCGRSMYRWTLADGMQALPNVPNISGHEPRAISDDGAVIVGVCTDSTGFDHGFIWTAAEGSRRVDLYLNAKGVSTSGLTIHNVVGVSGDGLRLVGNSSAGAWIAQLAPVEPPCYANCDNSSVAPVLNVLDFNCFLSRFAAGETYANCDGSTDAPTLNVLDFSCFLNRFNTGCP